MKLKRFLSNYTIICVVLTSIFISCERDSSSIEKNTINDQNSKSGKTTIRNISSMQLVEEMGVGWNLGNSLDVTSRDKTLWGNPLPSKAVIDAVKNMGFTTLRVPVTWGYHQNETAPYTVEKDYMDRVQAVVDYGFANDMHVILNVHHDNDWLKPTYAEAGKAKKRLRRLWKQIANRFKNYGDYLIFETLNENRLEGSPEEWSGGTPEGREVVNQFHNTALNAIRSTGGNNAKRHIMISTYAASTIDIAMNTLRIPNNDPNVIISLHTYFPWSFAGQENGQTQWGTPQEKAALDAEFDKIRQKWIIEQNRPVILGEWGTVDRNNLSERLEYTKYYAEGAIKRGLLPVVWDDGGNFGLFNRWSVSWRFPSIAETIIKADK
ncbi:glycoside hydrolase family 5 protein [Aquimarina algicola]|uniref:Glycoside hydrolase family 5 protein n=1 Tax=Aquimarina algicola TaxID=2589995 RepID=A0A504J6Y5_9FLAO|nr:glycoside hydrolase family 5 protein [Aquimarina algicola]TPN83363.1 glycoside hydrolase family 5 protein [Aquimarina algicola]